MRILTVALAASLAFVPLAGCAKFEAGWNAVTSSQVPDSLLQNVDEGWHAAQVALATYLRMPLCSPPTLQQAAPCSSIPMATKLRTAAHAVQIARDNAIVFARAHPGQLGTSGLYDAVTAAFTTFNQIVATLPPQAQAPIAAAQASAKGGK